MPDPVQRLIALVAGVLTLPLLAALAIAVRLDSAGPAIYAAERVGRGHRRFTCLKLRTMRQWGPARRNGEAEGAATTTATSTTTASRITGHRDPRITRVGALLRKTRLDELPQLWNVAKGEMRFVGPRPEDPRFVDLADPLHREVFAATPGITGLTQLVFADEASMLEGASDPEAVYRESILPRKLRIDRAYLRHRSPSLDLWILAQTPRAVLGHEIRLPAELTADLPELAAERGTDATPAGPAAEPDARPAHATSLTTSVRPATAGAATLAATTEDPADA